MYDLIVIGGGPAGLVATIYAIRKRLNVLMVTKDLGGKTNFRLALPWIEDYQIIRGLEIVNKFRNELEYLDFARHMEPVEKVEKLHSGEGYLVRTKGGGELHAKALIIASGAKQERLHVPGEKEFMMRGLCYSAVSYAPLFIDRTTAVVGDGDLAIRSAGELATIAKQVHIVAKSDEAFDSPLGKKLKSSSNVHILFGSEVIEVKGDDFARSIVIRDAAGKTFELEVDATFIEMDLKPNSQMTADLLKLDPKGRILIDCGNRTSEPGIFAAGDVTTTFAEQVLVAIGEGAKAALSAYEYLLPHL